METKTHTNTCDWCEGTGNMWAEQECLNCEGIGEVTLNWYDCNCIDCIKESEGN
jgi:DnaJ-class molecular chaperone